MVVDVNAGAVSPTIRALGYLAVGFAAGKAAEHVHRDSEALWVGVVGTAVGFTLAGEGAKLGVRLVQRYRVTAEERVLAETRRVAPGLRVRQLAGRAGLASAGMLIAVGDPLRSRP